jgi:hypothetical protein
MIGHLVFVGSSSAVVPPSLLHDWFDVFRWLSFFDQLIRRLFILSLFELDCNAGAVGRLSAARLERSTGPGLRYPLQLAMTSRLIAR